MKQIKQIDNSKVADDRTEPDTMPLPCNYFDLIVGTSTGGLVRQFPCQ